MSPQSLGSKKKSGKKPACEAGGKWNLLHAGFLLGAFDPEDGGDMFLRKFGSSD
jgi:hypothetical protein